MFLLWLRQLPQCGDRTPALVPPPAEGRSSATNTPVSPLAPLSYRVSCALYVLFRWSGTPVGSQLVFRMHFCVWRWTPDVSVERTACPPPPPPSCSLLGFISLLLFKKTGERQLRVLKCPLQVPIFILSLLVPEDTKYENKKSHQVWSSFSYFKMTAQVPGIMSVFKAEGWRKGQWIKTKGDQSSLCCFLRILTEVSTRYFCWYWPVGGHMASLWCKGCRKL